MQLLLVGLPVSLENNAYSKRPAILRVIIYIYIYSPGSIIFFSLFFTIALGQIMLYVDGMNGVINHNETIQWLYTLIGSKVRHSPKFLLYMCLVFFKSILFVLRMH